MNHYIKSALMVCLGVIVLSGFQSLDSEVASESSESGTQTESVQAFESNVESVGSITFYGPTQNGHEVGIDGGESAAWVADCWCLANGYGNVLAQSLNGGQSGTYYTWDDVGGQATGQVKNGNYDQLFKVTCNNLF